MRTQALLTVVLSVFVVLLQPGCGGTGSAQSSWLACDADQFKLQGTLADQSVDILENTAGGGFTQLGTGEFSTQYLASSAERTKLDLAWSQTVNDGETTHASGTLTMPSSGTLAGQSFCLGDGTLIHFSSDGETLQFALAGITGGTNCGSAIVGTLQGCWR
jgi:hypothetical protein